MDPVVHEDGAIEEVLHLHLGKLRLDLVCEALVVVHDQAAMVFDLGFEILSELPALWDVEH